MGDLGIAWNLGILAAAVLGGVISWKISGWIQKIVIWLVLIAGIVGAVWYLI